MKVSAWMRVSFKKKLMFIGWKPEVMFDVHQGISYQDGPKTQRRLSVRFIRKRTHCMSFKVEIKDEVKNLINEEL